MIKIITKKDGKIILNSTAKNGVTLEEIIEIAENEVFGGYADYSKVEVDGKTYAEYEA